MKLYINIFFKIDDKCVLNVILLKFCSYAMFKTLSALQLMFFHGF